MGGRCGECAAFYHFMFCLIMLALHTSSNLAGLCLFLAAPGSFIIFNLN